MGLNEDLPYVIGQAMLWALVWLGAAWVVFERTRNDLCLTGKIYALPYSHWGTISPDDPGGHCRCGSTRPRAECEHTFGKPYC